VLDEAVSSKVKTTWTSIPSKPGNSLPIVNPYGVRDIVTYLPKEKGAYHGKESETPASEGSVMKPANGYRGSLV